MNPLRKLAEHSQSIWLDYIRRTLMTGGELNRLIEEDGLRGMTSNPTIFEKAIAGSVDYDESLRKTLDRDPHVDIKTLYETLAIEDIQMATDVLRPLYEESQGADGYVSLEVSPRLANDTEKTVAEAKRLWRTVDRPNVMIKVPATPAGVPAFEALIADGININCTLMFSLKHYEDIAQAYIRGVERCKNPQTIASVASFFVSRIDGVVDKALEANGSPEAKALLGKIAVANAKLAYKRFEEIFYGDAFAALKAKGARAQRPLWASTSTKNPDYRDVLYVEELIGPDTVNTLPPATLSAFRDHGKVEPTLAQNVEEAEAQIHKLAQLGIDLDAITEKLQVDGVASFAKSFEELLEALKKKRSSILSSRSQHQYLNLGDGEEAVGARLEQWQHDDYAVRLWQKDPTLWSSSPAPELTDRLGWLSLPRDMHDQIDAIQDFARAVCKDGFTHAVLCGMGGSSLAPEVYHETFGHKKNCPELIVLDSTHPGAVAAVRERIDPSKTLFIISSKSGTTTETLSFFKYFWNEIAPSSGEPGRHFVAVTDPGTPLEALAAERGFRHVFHAPTEVGGRYSALSVFGLVPAAVTGLDVHRILDGAWAMMENTGAAVPVTENPALALGAAIGELALAGRDKLTIVTSQSLRALPAWIEQLVAESTGKEGQGVVPVVGEPLGPADVYGEDRFFVYLSTQGESTECEDALGRLEFAGHPVARVQIKEPTLIGQEFFRWEMATAAVGSVLGIHPFNQPDVQLAKDLARRKMAEAESRGASGWDDGIETIYVDKGGDAGATLERWLGAARPGDYVAIQAYLPPGDATTSALGEFRTALRNRTRLATTLGYGPRFLHSTGQLHKGGPNTGLFLQVVDDVPQGMEVPEADYTFGDLMRAQAMGDAQALNERGRHILRVSVGRAGAGGLSEMLQMIRG